MHFDRDHIVSEDEASGGKFLLDADGRLEGDATAAPRHWLR